MGAGAEGGGMITPHAIEIDRGIPLPPPAKGKYPFARMRVGDSFFVDDLARISAVRTALRYRMRCHHGERYTARKKPTGIRVWRVA
jgi:hypothetical protein